MANNITAVGIETLINIAWRNQANSYITTNPERATSVDAAKITNGTIITTRVLDTADRVSILVGRATTVDLSPGRYIEPSYDILGEGTFQLDFPPNYNNKLSFALFMWAQHYSAVRYCRFEVQSDTGPIPAYYKYCYLWNYSDAMSVNGITPAYIGDIAGITTGEDIVYQNIVDVVEILKAHLKNVHEDSAYGTLQTVCHSSCHYSCHSSRSRR